MAHGTVGIAIVGDDSSSEPHAIGTMKICKWRDTDELMSMEELKNAVNVTAQIVEELNEMLGDE